jgi:hypothetical protein
MEMSRVSCPSQGLCSHSQRRVALQPLCPMRRPGTPQGGYVEPTRFRGDKPLPLAERLASLGSLCYSRRSAAGKGRAPPRVAVTFSQSPIDSKKKIRYTVPHLHNRFFDNRNSDSCPLSESSKMSSRAISMALVSHLTCTESLILAQNERWRRT